MYGLHVFPYYLLLLHVLQQTSFCMWIVPFPLQITLPYEVKFVDAPLVVHLQWLYDHSHHL